PGAELASAETSAGIAVNVGSLGPPDAIFGALGVAATPGVGGAVAAAAAGASWGAGTGAIVTPGAPAEPVSISAAIRAIAIIICVGSAMLGSRIGLVADATRPGVGGAVDEAAVAAWSGDSGTGTIEEPLNSSPAIREIAMASWA